MVRSAGRTNSSKEIIDDAGLPGRPNQRVVPTVAKASGLPGRIATFHRARVAPRSASAALTWSWSPTETPPVVSTT
ncbi:MAG: hypothetical protein R2939_07535 [Kofleriaceae bacterium]